jgi:hypothetical protein
MGFLRGDTHGGLLTAGPRLVPMYPVFLRRRCLRGCRARCPASRAAERMFQPTGLAVSTRWVGRGLWQGDRPGRASGWADAVRDLLRRAQALHGMRPRPVPGAACDMCTRELSIFCVSRGDLFLWCSGCVVTVGVSCGARRGRGRAAAHRPEWRLPYQ